MIDDELVLRIQRLRDTVDNFRRTLRSTYQLRTASVSSREIRARAANLAEQWLVEIAIRREVGPIIGPEKFANLSIEFQRLLTTAERVSPRKDYDACLSFILDDFTNEVIVPLKQHRGLAASDTIPPAQSLTEKKSIFIGKSFLEEDEDVTEMIGKFLASLKFDVVDGEKPSTGGISDKVRKRIEGCDIFVGIFTRRHRIARTKLWTTSDWVIDEKAYALAKNKTLVLLKESGVQSIGGIQGDYEYLEFERDHLDQLFLKLVLTLRP